MKNTYLRKDLRDSNVCGARNLKYEVLKENAMCKRVQIETYVNINALPDNAQSSFSLENTIVVGHYL